MLGLNSPAIQVEAKHGGVGAERVDSANAGNLAKRLPLCVGCRVMLTRNLWGNVGLVNGAQGTVYDISWAEGADVLTDPPEVVMVAFDSYIGPAFASADGRELRDGAKLVVPILRIRQDFTVGTNTCYREQFPLLVCYAITVHKSQGVTLEEAVCDISAPEFASGLSYVAVSRVRTLDGLMFEAPFDRSRIYREVPIRSMQLKLADYETRKLQALDAQAKDHSGSFDGYTSSEDSREAIRSFQGPLRYVTVLGAVGRWTDIVASSLPYSTLTRLSSGEGQENCQERERGRKRPVA
jgi:hypothetical protein